MRQSPMRSLVIIGVLCSLSQYACKNRSTNRRQASALSQSSEDINPQEAKHTQPIVHKTAALQEVGPLQPGIGFPSWYKDNSGLMLEPCFAPDPLCLPADGFDPGQPLIFPTNFPGEFFWHTATATLPTTGGGQITWLAAVEGAFANEVPIEGERVVFGRIRIRGSNLEPGSYRVTHPYGIDMFEVLDAGPKSINFTEDIAAVAENFTAVYNSRVGPFLRWDSNIAPAAPAGYLGDPGVNHEVTGSPYGTNFVRVERMRLDRAPIEIGFIRQFSISGKLHVFKVFADKPEGTYNPAPTITLGASRSGATIRYSLDGSDPANGLLYTQPFSLPPGTSTLRVVATHPESGTSQVRQFTYTVDPLSLAVGLAESSDLEGVYNRTISVALQSYGGAEGIKYTLDSTDPRTSATALDYSAPLALSVNGSYELAAVAVKNGSYSPLRRFRFTVKKRHTQLGPVNVAHGFPYWYEDLNSRLRLVPCFDPDEQRCLPLEGVDPTRPVSFPANFPGEFFYWTGESTGLFENGGRALLVLAVEGAFMNENVIPGDQAVFGRIRIRLDTPEGGLHRVTHPFGVEHFNLQAGGRRSVNFTQDIELAAGGFHFIETGRVQMLTPGGPSGGFIANPTVPVKLTGGPNGTDYFRVERFNGTTWDALLDTDEFFVTGQKATDEVLVDIAPGTSVVRQWPTIRMSASEMDAKIWYTLDGSDPKSTNLTKLYTEPFVPTSQASSLTIHAFAESNNKKSAIALTQLTLDTEPPSLTVAPAGGLITGPIEITFSKNDPTAVTYYTLDGTDPRESLSRNLAGDRLVIDPLPSVELRAVAQDAAGNFSAIIQETYTVGTPQGPVGGPVVSALGYSLVRDGTSLGMLVNWDAQLTSGTIVKYSLEVSTNGGPWTPLPISTLTAKSHVVPVVIPVATGSLKFRVQAQSSHGLSSSWHESPLLVLDYTTETLLTTVRYNGLWNQIGFEGAVNGSLRVTSTANDSVRFDFSGIAMAVISAQRSTGGTIAARFDGQTLSDEVLTANLPVTQVPIFIQNGLAVGPHRIELSNTTTGREFLFDGILTVTAQ